MPLSLVRSPDKWKKRQSLVMRFAHIGLYFPEIRAVPLINPGRGDFEELKVHFLMEKEQQQKERLLKDYLFLIEIPVIGLGYDVLRIINAARYVKPVNSACELTNGRFI